MQNRKLAFKQRIKNSNKAYMYEFRQNSAASILSRKFKLKLIPNEQDRQGIFRKRFARLH